MILPPRLVVCSWQCWNVQSRHSELHRPQRAKKVCDQDLVRITFEQILSHTNCGDANSFGANSKLKEHHTKTWLTMITINNQRDNAYVCVHVGTHRHMHACAHVWNYCLHLGFNHTLKTTTCLARLHSYISITSLLCSWQQYLPLSMMCFQCWTEWTK
jgi:hypothetical protein